MFLYPLNKAFEFRDSATMNWSAIGLALSVCNHSHAWHADKSRKTLFKWIDVLYMHAFTFKTLYNSLTSSQCVTLSAFVSTLMSTLFKSLGDTEFEEYSEIQKNTHMLFHIVSITLLTLLHEKCFWNISQI